MSGRTSRKKPKSFFSEVLGNDMPKWDGIRPEARGKGNRVRRAAIGPRRMPKNWEARQKRAAERAQAAVDRAARHLEKKRNTANACVSRCQASFNRVRKRRLTKAELIAMA